MKHGKQGARPQTRSYLNNSLEKGLATLEAVVLLGHHATVRAIADRTGINYSTTHRLLATLAECGYVERNPKSLHFSIGPELQRLDQVRSNSFLINLARGTLRQLADLTGETATLSRRQGTELVLLAVEQGINKLTMKTRPGDFYPIHCTASGKAILSRMLPSDRNKLLARLDLKSITDFTIDDIPALLSELDDVRRKGFSINVEEHVDRIEAVAAPVVDETNRVAAALCLTVPTNRIPTGKDISIYSDLVKSLSRSLSERMEEVSSITRL